MADPNWISLIDYLPAVFREDPDNPDNPFVPGLLRPFEEVLNAFSTCLAHIEDYFDPATTGSNFLPWLATWVALVLDEDWPEARRRELIKEAVDLYKRRGTVSGLMKYLEIYTGVEPEIHECCWPGGMQIGVASQLGALNPPVDFASFTFEHQLPPHYYDYYVVTEEGPPPKTYYYRADRVRQVDIDTTGKRVTVHHLVQDDPTPREQTHENATVVRRDGLIDDRYLLTGTPRAGGESLTAEYTGDTVFIDEVEMPYRFIVVVRVSPDNRGKIKIDKIQAIVDLEKPAHTLCYVKLITEKKEDLFQPMQLGVRSTISVDTIVG